MSDLINSDLLERAGEVKTYFEDTILEDAIDNAIERNELEVLQHLVVEAEAEMSRQDFYNTDTMPPSYNPSDDATVINDIRGEQEASDVY